MRLQLCASRGHAAGAPCVLPHRWDKIGSWKAKLDDREMADALPTLAQLKVKDNCKSSGVIGMHLQIAVACSTSHLMPIVSHCPFPFDRLSLYCWSCRCMASFTWCIAATDSESALPDPELPGDLDPISPHAHAVPPRFPPVSPLCLAISSPSLIC